MERNAVKENIPPSKCGRSSQIYGIPMSSHGNYYSEHYQDEMAQKYKHKKRETKRGIQQIGGGRNSKEVYSLSESEDNENMNLF